MKVYHGTRLDGLRTLMAGQSQSFPGLYVTDTPGRALRYANAQATGVVDPDATELAEGAAVVELEAEISKWWRRPEDHPTLDKCETVIQSWTVRRICLRRHEYPNTMISVGYRQYVKEDAYLASIADTGVVIEEARNA